VSEIKNGKKTVWLYAVILFTSAFIVLLLTAYSQIKFTKNIDEYESRLSDQEKAKYSVQQSYSLLKKENEKLKKQIDSLNDKIKSINNKPSLYSEYYALQYKHTKALKSYESLMKADQAYNSGDYINCAQLLLKQCEVSVLEVEAKNLYNYLKNKTYLKAARELYGRGFSYYKKGKFHEAVTDFNSSLELVDKEYFSDDCVFFAAYSEFNMGNKTRTQHYIDLLIKKYPDSSYMNDAKNLQKLLAK